MRCAICASEIPTASKACSYCGHIVKPSEAFPNLNGLPMYTEREKICKYCGAPIDADTGLCPHCERSYTKGNVALVLLYVLSILLVFSILLGAIGWISYNAEKKDTYWLDKYTELQKQMQELPSKENLNYYKEKVSFYENYIVLINSEDDEFYHIYDCEDCADTFVWIGYVGSAEDSGFKPCNKCAQ